ncbi:carbohydrate ABC transporter permease [Hamadaea tsunoensis]|uniref:carbohydrate ABC transporter permease n=1 Tax=Hamadaea tsunoensis TaxID=53368 RepID=UPI00040D21F5|nr:carbohydrate ABC transporter permease [Hamadaea tsunoensis]
MSTADIVQRRPHRVRPARALLHAFLALVAVGWLIPLLLAVYASIRPYQETSERGYLSWPKHLTFHYYLQAWRDADLPHYYLNTLIIAVPAVLVTLFLASFVAFAISRFQLPGSKFLLVMFTAGNLLPPQAMLIPLYTIYLKIPLPEFLSASQTLYDSYLGVILIHVAFQTGFCVFVLRNYMQTVPKELTEAAIMDGAGVWRQYWGVILPLCRPALGALATLEFTWIYNDFLWALVLISTGDKMPITTAINNLQGQYFTDYNLIAAGSVLVALPTILVFLLLQKQFVAGLTLGSTKG